MIVYNNKLMRYIFILMTLTDYYIFTPLNIHGINKKVDGVVQIISSP